MKDNGMAFDDEQLRQLAEVLWEDAGVPEGANLTYNDFKNQLESHPGVAEGLVKRLVLSKKSIKLAF